MLDVIYFTENKVILAKWGDQMTSVPDKGFISAAGFGVGGSQPYRPPTVSLALTFLHQGAWGILHKKRGNH